MATPVSCRPTNASAPGRVNLIGEHTDHQLGRVLPVAVRLRTTVRIEPRPGGSVVVRSGGGRPAEYAVGRERRTGSWLDHVAGVTWALAKAGHVPGGAALEISSSIPSGAGLASSAALGVAVARAFREAYALDLDDRAVAAVAHRAETAFVGARVGTMDHLVASLGREGTALAIDARDGSVEPIPLPEALDVAAVHSGIRHANAAGAYNALRAELDEACALLGVSALREVPDEGALSGLPERLRRRARHVMREDARVLAAMAALRAGDGPALGRILAEGHASLAGDLGVSTPEVDALVRIAASHPDAYGARLTGAGWGGAVVVLARAGCGRAVAESVARAYALETGRPGRALLP